MFYREACVALGNSVFQSLVCGNQNGQPVIIQYISQKVWMINPFGRMCILA